MTELELGDAVPRFKVHVQGNGRELIKVLPNNTVIIASDITLVEALQVIGYMATSLAEMISQGASK